jgi:tetratricopeptide (TPR) repeat protein
MFPEECTMSPHNLIRSQKNALLLVALAGCLTAGLTACSSTPELTYSLEPMAQIVRDRGLDPQEILAPFRMSEEMEAWLAEEIPEVIPQENRTTALLQALLSERGLKLEYAAGFTGTVGEVFDTGKANCLGFTHLFVAMARQLGEPVYYLKIDDIYSYTQEGDLVISSGHVTAASGYGDNHRILEFTQLDVDYRQVRPIPDLTAIALYYSNRAGELLRVGRAGEGLRYADIAVRLEPELLDGWINLGVIRRRLGDLPGAEEAYRRALEADHEAPITYQNLAALYSHQGNYTAAKEVLALADQRSNRNPYTYLDLGDFSLRQGDLDAAERFYRRALRLDSKLVEAHAAMGLYAVEAGEMGLARRSLRKARRLDPESDWVSRLERRLHVRAQIP